MVETIMKRDGRTVEFKQEKIAEAVERAFQACGAMQDRAAAEDIAQHYAIVIRQPQRRVEHQLGKVIFQ